MKFKNLRRPSRSEKAGIEVSPAAKRIKVDTTESTVSTPSASDEAAYDRHVKHLQKVYDSQKWSVPRLTSLMEETAVVRRQWITNECPPVKVILEKFPCLKEPKIVSCNTFTCIINYE